MTGALFLVLSFWAAFAAWAVWTIRPERARRKHVEQRRAELNTWLPEQPSISVTEIVERLEQEQAERDQYGRHSLEAVSVLVPSQRASESEAHNMHLLSGDAFVPMSGSLYQEAS